MKCEMETLFFFDCPAWAQTPRAPPDSLARALDGLNTVGVRVTVDAVDAVDAVRLDLLGDLLGLWDGRLLGVSLRVGSEITGIDVGLLALVGAVSLLDESLVLSEDRLEFRDLNVVEEDALAELAVWDGETLLSVSGFPAVSIGLVHMGSWTHLIASVATAINSSSNAGWSIDRPTEVTRVNHWSRCSSLMIPRE